MKRYAAKLLFQFRVSIRGNSGTRRTCEERIVVLNATSAKSALAQAKQKGIVSTHKYKNSDGFPVKFEFIGVMELLELDGECEDDEVWYDIVMRVLPSERKGRLIPSESELSAIRNEFGRRGVRRRFWKREGVDAPANGPGG